MNLKTYVCVNACTNVSCLSKICGNVKKVKYVLDFFLGFDKQVWWHVVVYFEVSGSAPDEFLLNLSEFLSKVF